MHTKLTVSIDLDMWWQCRWATGSEASIWPDCRSLFQECYGCGEPGGEVVGLTHELLDMFDASGIRATFFILGQMGELFPDLVRTIASRGHEIACHGYYHVDAPILGREGFREQVGRAKTLLEDLSGTEVRGYRAPNLVLAPWFFDEVAALGFGYDSSICPARSFFGKYADHKGTPSNPYVLPESLFLDLANHGLVEVPIPVMPGLALPAGSGIITRVLGAWWSLLALRLCLRRGDALYYFHPYEIGEKPELPNETAYIRLFFRNVGEPYKRMLRRLFALGKGGHTQTATEAAEAARRRGGR